MRQYTDKKNGVRTVLECGNGSQEMPEGSLPFEKARCILKLLQHKFFSYPTGGSVFVQSPWTLLLIQYLSILNDPKINDNRHWFHQPI